MTIVIKMHLFLVPTTTHNIPLWELATKSDVIHTFSQYIFNWLSSLGLLWHHILAILAVLVLVEIKFNRMI